MQKRFALFLSAMLTVFMQMSHAQDQGPPDTTSGPPIVLPDLQPNTLPTALPQSEVPPFIEGSESPFKAELGKFGLRVEGGIHSQVWQPMTTSGTVIEPNGLRHEVTFFDLKAFGLDAYRVELGLTYDGKAPFLTYTQEGPVVDNRSQNYLFNGQKNNEVSGDSSALGISLRSLSDRWFPDNYWARVLTGFSYTHTESLYLAQATVNFDLNYISDSGTSTILPKGSVRVSSQKMVQDRLSFTPWSTSEQSLEVGLMTRIWQRPDTWSNYRTTINGKDYPVVANTQYTAGNVPFIGYAINAQEALGLTGYLGFAWNGAGVIPGSSVQGVLPRYVQTQNPGKNLAVDFKEVMAKLEYTRYLLKGIRSSLAVSTGVQMSYSQMSLLLSDKEIYRGNEIWAQPYVVMKAAF